MTLRAFFALTPPLLILSGSPISGSSRDHIGRQSPRRLSDSRLALDVTKRKNPRE